MARSSFAKRLPALVAQGAIMLFLPPLIVAGVVGALMVGQTGEMTAAIGEEYFENPYWQASDVARIWAPLDSDRAAHGLNDADVLAAFVAMNNTEAFRLEFVESMRQLGQSWEDRKPFHQVMDLSSALQEAEAVITPAVADAVRANPELSLRQWEPKGNYQPMAFTVLMLSLAAGLLVLEILISRSPRNVPARLTPVAVYALFALGVVRGRSAADLVREKEVAANWLLQRTQLTLATVVVVGMAMWWISRSTADADEDRPLVAVAS